MSKSSLKKIDLRYRLYFKIIDTSGATVHKAIPWVGLDLIAYLAYLSIHVLSGRQTFAAIFVTFLVRLRISKWLAYLVGTGGVVYGLRCRKLWKDTTVYMNRRIDTLGRGQGTPGGTGVPVDPTSSTPRRQR
jgi:hypothetical protein